MSHERKRKFQMNVLRNGGCIVTGDYKGEFERARSLVQQTFAEQEVVGVRSREPSKLGRLLN